MAPNKDSWKTLFCSDKSNSPPILSSFRTPAACFEFFQLLAWSRCFLFHACLDFSAALSPLAQSLGCCHQMVVLTNNLNESVSLIWLASPENTVTTYSQAATGARSKAQETKSPLRPDFHWSLTSTFIFIDNYLLLWSDK